MQFLVIVGCVLATIPVKCNGIRTLFLQPNNVPSNESYAYQMLKPPSNSDIVVSDFSVALWIKIHHFRDSTYVFSYAVSDEKNNELNFGIRKTFAFIVINGMTLQTHKNVTLIPEAWYHFAFVYNNSNKTIQFYINGFLHKTTVISSSRELYLNGSIVLGQETDKLRGEFNDMQSFSGQIADFNIWSRSLPASDVTTLSSCDGNGSAGGRGDVVHLGPSAPWTLEGSVVEGNISFQEICTRDRSALQIFPEHFKFKEALSFCNKLKSDIFTPFDEEQNTWAYDQMEQFVRVCKPKNHGSSFMWLGMTDKEEDGIWTDLQGRLLNYTNFNSDGRNSRQNCASYEKAPAVYKWNDISCGKTYNLCASCFSKERTVFKMRGLCEEKSISSWFLMDTKIVDFKHHFRGFTKYTLQLQSNTQNKTQWALVDMWQNNITMATWDTHNAEYPLGLRNWTVAQDYLLCELPLMSTIALSLSSCYDDEFTCSDGTCVELDKRCDLRADCPDASDEVGCEKVLMPPEYISSLPPPGANKVALAVNISITIRAFSEIDIRNMIIKVDMIVKSSWRESRLKFKNIREIQDINYVDPTQVWYPEFDLLNADFPEVHRTDPRITVRRSSDAEADDAALPVHDEIFLGESNPLELSQKVNAPFTCEMDLKNFPFDIQYCTMQFEMSSVRADFASWETVDVRYDGERLLTEYEIGTLRTGVRMDELHSVAVVQVPLYGRYWFYVTSSYLPIMMLVVISYASLFCRHENPDLRIMMALTALLVLYALYQQIAAGLPKTSYTKAVDIWCFFAITLIFSQVIFHVAIDFPVWPQCCQQRVSVSSTSKDEEAVSFTSSNAAGRPDTTKLLRIARITYVVLFIVFFIIYWSIVLTNKSALEKRGLLVL